MIHVGQKVRYDHFGAVTAIRGEQHPMTVSSIAGVVLTGGNAEFDIVFDNGTGTRRLPEAVLYRAPWKIYAQIYSPAEVQKMLAFAASETARKQTEAESAVKTFEEEVSRLRADPRYAALTQTDPACSMSGGKLAAANIRRQLKAAFPRTKFSVKMTSYDSVRVQWVDGPAMKSIHVITGNYSGGYFDGMEDMYHYADSPWTRVFGPAKYVFETHTHSVAAVTDAVKAVCDRYGWPLIEVKAWSHGGSAYLGDCEPNQSRAVMEFLEGEAQ